MGIVVEKPKIGVHGKRAKFYRAYTGDPTNVRTQEICNGEIGESAADVRKRALELLTFAVNHHVIHVRTASPGIDGERDVWILQGDSTFGFEYGRVFDRYSTGKPTWNVGTGLGVISEAHALHAMLEHMADSYPEESWSQFLWNGIGCRVDVEAIKAEIRKRNTEREAMRAAR